jgi:hypothetical protein
MYPTIALFVTAAAGLGGYLIAKRFVGHRLRFVDAVQSPWAPWIAGAAAAILASPLGLGTASGVRMIRRGDVSRRQLIP